MFGDAINCHWRHGALSPLQTERFPPTTLISTLRIVKEQQPTFDGKPKTPTPARPDLFDQQGLQWLWFAPNSQEDGCTMDGGG